MALWALVIAVMTGPACVTPGSAGATSTSTTSTTSTSADETGASSGPASGPMMTGSTGGCGVLCDVSVPYACDLWVQDCPEGEKCSAGSADGGASWSSTRCVPVAPDPDEVGEPCSVVDDGRGGIDSCVAGAMCRDLDPRTATGVCVALCQGDEVACVEDRWACCPPGSWCSLASEGILDLCAPGCDPLLLDCAIAGEVCYPADRVFTCRPDQSGDQGAVGDPCESYNQCGPGTYCGDSMTHPKCDTEVPGCCVPFCSLAAPVCLDGAECLPWFDPEATPIGYEDLGSCVIPGMERP
ncbi:MAG: hypothetical protein R3B09_02215 [Nannocystaceae bacterium]